ncbi:hypothetical protein LY632_03970 [Erythrobacter sp. SDW2]|uniref:hypothetical protein n=1 Tax=Erythrobacter sp. SDW2 TaxID=2907154 RepID=UPI001F4643E9|nr:hypothetical protein [Erythrobacter sp. SDW2]UIP07566.1 hypothetical protein LY632_03970 [Erythrobacter sp. SDW2]
MDSERRKLIEQKRQFNRARLAVKELRDRAEPAFSTLLEAGEDFNLRSLADAKRWGPSWLTRASYVQWREIDDVQWAYGFDDDRQKLAKVAEILCGIVGPEDRILVCEQFQLDLTRAAFERHIDAIFEAAWRPYITAEKAEWLIEVKGGEIWWKVG